MPRAPVAAKQYVLVPSYASIKGFVERQADAPPFVFIGAHMEVVGPTESLVRTLTRQRVLVPNAFIIGIGSGARAARGDIVLTSRVGSSALARAIVIGGDSATPHVRYLDDAPSEIADDTLAPDTFRRLEDGEIGTSVACQEGQSQVERMVVNRSKDRLLGLGFGGALAMRDNLDCKAVPLRPRAEVGARVYVPVVGVFRPAKVMRKEADGGRVLASYDFAGKETEASFGFGDVADDLAPTR